MKRFEGKSGSGALLDALRQQRTLACCEPAISEIARVSKLQSYPAHRALMIEGSEDNRLALILSGQVDILVKGHKVAERKSAQHVGEMSVIDPSARRSATVVTSQKTEVAWVEEKDFTRIACSHPQLWRQLAVELADRLRQRGALVRDRNRSPEVFIGSSAEALKVASALQRTLKPDPISTKIWKQGVFGASEATIESLEKQLARCDFAVLILTADDKVRTRGSEHLSPRDNIVFELGLFMGAIGRNRTFMLVESGKSLRLPPDLHGVTYLPLLTTTPAAMKNTVEDGASAIRDRITKLGSR